MAKDTNWFGLECHPTDSYINWRSEEAENLLQAALLRSAYDIIVAAGLQNALDVLTKAAYQSGCSDEYDSTGAM